MLLHHWVVVCVCGLLQTVLFGKSESNLKWFHCKFEMCPFKIVWFFFLMKEKCSYVWIMKGILWISNHFYTHTCLISNILIYVGSCISLRIDFCRKNTNQTWFLRVCVPFFIFFVCVFLNLLPLPILGQETNCEYNSYQKQFSLRFQLRDQGIMNGGSLCSLNEPETLVTFSVQWLERKKFDFHQQFGCQVPCWGAAVK